MASGETEVSLCNSTLWPLTLDESGTAAEYGVFYITPPYTIMPRETGNWKTGSNRFYPGNEGKVAYFINDRLREDGLPAVRVWLHWGGPEWEPNSRSGGLDNDSNHKYCLAHDNYENPAKIDFTVEELSII